MCKKMGIHNKITRGRYYEIKAELKVPADDARVMKKYGIGQTVARYIRNTRNFEEYRSRSTTARNAAKRLERIMANNPIPRDRVVYNPPAKGPTPNEIAEFILATIAIVAFVLSIIAMIAGVQR